MTIMFELGYNFSLWHMNIHVGEQFEKLVKNTHEWHILYELIPLKQQKQFSRRNDSRNFVNN